LILLWYDFRPTLTRVELNRRTGMKGILNRAVLLGAAALLPLHAFAHQPTPKDPKSPVPGAADGRGPSGPVELKIVSPKPDEVIPMPPAQAGQPEPKGAPVTVKVELRNFETFEEAATKTGQHLEILVDSLPSSFPWRDATKPYTFKSLPKGTHTLRIVAVRPWGEAIKEPAALGTVTFHVGEKDGKQTPEPGVPMVTVVAPRGKVKGAGGKVLFDFLVAGCAVAENTVPDSCRVRYKIDTQPEVTLTKADPVWLEQLAPGRHVYVVGLTREGKIVPGAFALYQGAFEVESGAAPPPAPAAGPGGGAP
jgi:hypothetical protein